jgi:hypothetical protein
MRPPLQCLLDMDGVLFDFMTALAKVHNRPSPYDLESSYGIWDTEKLWGITEEQFWEPIQRDSLNFWSNIPLTPEAKEIVAFAENKFGTENVAILTAPSDDPGAVPGKRISIAREFPQFEKKMLFGSAKQFLAAPNRFLIDDRDKNVDGFEAAGGHSIQVPRPWNRFWKHKDYVMAAITAQYDIEMEEIKRKEEIFGVRPN